MEEEDGTTTKLSAAREVNQTFSLAKRLNQLSLSPSVSLLASEKAPETE